MRSARPLWAMLAALTATFALSQAFRTVPAVLVGQIAQEFGASPRAIGLFAGAFAVTFGAMQIFIGVALDRYGPRRTICALFPLAALGSIVSALAPTFAVLVVGQIILGISSAPAYISTLVFIVRRYPPRQFTTLSAITMSLGGLGMLLTATPLAWVVQTFGWRAAFVALGAASLVALLACLWLLDERQEDHVAQETFGEAIRSILPIFRMPQTAGILCLGGVLYGSFLAVRTPWIVPLFEQRYGYSLVDAGNVVLIFSIAMVLSPLPFARLDPGGRHRRYLLIALTFAMAAVIAALGAQKASPSIDWALALVLATLSGAAMLEYPDLRSSYPARIVGRAIALLNMAMFFGVAVVQWLAGIVAQTAITHGRDPITSIFLTLTGLLCVAATAYWLLPWPRIFDQQEPDAHEKAGHEGPALNNERS